MHDLLVAIEAHVIKSLPEYVTILGLFMIAVVVAMPHADVIDRWLGAWEDLACDARLRHKAWQKFKDFLSIWYRWIYDSVQGFMASRNPQPRQTASLEVKTPTSSTVSKTETTLDPNAPPNP